MYLKNNFFERDKDVRAYLNQMIFEDEDDFKAYPAPIQEKFRILVKTFMSWGIDIVAFNPDLKVLFETA